MQSPCKISNIHEIVVDRSCLDEGTLITGDLAIHERLQLQCQDFCDDFGNAMNETYWPVILDMDSINLLRKQGNEESCKKKLLPKIT